MILSRSLPAALALALSLCAPFASSQTAAAPAAQPSPGMPKDPAALMQLAEQVNGLTGPGMKPWHIKLSYQTYDSDGKPKDQGTFEEWWAAPDKDKRVYTSPSFTQTEYFTSKGVFRTGAENIGPPFAEYLLRERLTSPLTSLTAVPGADLHKQDNPFPKSKLTCVERRPPLKSEYGAPVGLFPLYCFNQDRPMLRFSGSFGLLNTEYESVGQLDGRYVGTSLRITDSGKPLITAHLLEGSLLPAGAESAFTPPADAVPCPNPAPATAKPELIAGHKLSGSPPSYPASARRNHVEGKVILSALIGEDGRIHQLEIVSAPDPSLAISALTAVRDWIYRPYQLNGAPVRVSTQINVDYALN